MSPPVVLRARYVFPVVAPPIAAGYVSVREGRIVSAGNRRPEGPIEDLGNVAILPGLINAHTHLEFSDLSVPFGRHGIDFVAWLRRVVEHRRAKAVADDGPEQASIGRRSAAVTQGMAECLQQGTTHVGDIVPPDASSRTWDVDAGHAAGMTAFQELLGLSAEKLDPLMDLAHAHLDSAVWQRPGFRPGFSPHAPYTVSCELVARVASLAAQTRTPVAMHLAESVEEIELLASHSGTLVELLSEWDAWDPTAVPRGIRPLEYLRQLARAEKALIVHGNFLDAEEMEFLASHRGSMSLVYCPRTPDHYDHGEYDLSARLDAGVDVCLGTDSRASNPNLNLLAEMRFVANHQAGVSPTQILEMATLAAAGALGIHGEAGALEVTKRADLAILQLPEHDADDPHELLFDAAGEVVRVYCNGRRVV
jgi:cytosine/adenosine deaminase-related metal-dependent hydrolase